jgi:hypothetical protein
MSCRYGATPEQRLRIEFVEADFEIGFNLVDIAEGESIQAHHAQAGRALADAEDVFAAIQQRLKVLDATDSCHFEPLVGELRRAIDLAKLHNA